MNWHIHQWTKWEIEEYIFMRFHLGEDRRFIREMQERQCIKCGKTQVSRINTN